MHQAAKTTTAVSRKLLTLLSAWALIIVSPLEIMAETKIEKINFKGWPNCYRVSNPTVEIIATSDVGPRIIHLGFVDGKNLFRVFEEQAGRVGGARWMIYGGHRLWHSPEDRVRTYELDNSPVEIEEIADGLLLRQKPEPNTGIQKTIEVTMDPVQARIRLLHRLKNVGLWPIQLAAWALSVMQGGGFAIVPLPTRYHADYLLPNRSITLWPYTDVRDERFFWGRDFILLKHLEGRNPTKLGVRCDEEWAAYSLDSYLFVKRFRFVQDSQYPDFGSSVEVYTDADMLELETVGPLRVLQPDEELTHEEWWELHENVTLDFSEQAVRAKLLPLVK